MLYQSLSAPLKVFSEAIQDTKGHPRLPQRPQPLDCEALRIRRRRASHLEGLGFVVVCASVVVAIEIVGRILRRSKSFNPSSWHSRQSFQRGSAER